MEAVPLQQGMSCMARLSACPGGRARLLGLDPGRNPYRCPDQRLTTVRSSPGGGGEGCTRHSNRSLDAVPGGERPAG